MTGWSLLMMLLMFTILWGGLIVLFLIALGKERQKSDNEPNRCG